MMWLINSNVAHAGGELLLPNWHLEQGWLIIIGAVTAWIMVKSKRISEPLSRSLRFIAIVLTLLSLLWVVGDINRTWFLLTLIVGLGWSLKELALDLFSSLLLKLEGKSSGYVVQEQFSGSVQSIGWREVTLIDEDKVPLLVPARFLVTKPVKFYPLGRIPTTLHFWLPDNLCFQDALRLINNSAHAIPWLRDSKIRISEDRQNPNVMKIEMTLMRLQDRGLVKDWIGRKLQKASDNH